jgi:hypothetical protein
MTDTRRSIGNTNLKLVAETVVVAISLVFSAGQLAAAPKAPVAIPGGGTATRLETALNADANAVLLAREARTRDALGFPVGAQRTGKHVRDGFVNAEYDEVAELDTAGNVKAITQFDPIGRLRDAVRLDLPPVGGTRVTRDRAAITAQQAATAAGLSVGTPTSIDADPATGGWTARWARTAGGVPVRGDETRAQIWPDGRIQSMSRAEHSLAAAPLQRIGAGTARDIATANLDSWFAGRPSAYTVQNVELQWVGANAAFDPVKVDAPEAPYRLAWVTQVKPAGEAANFVWLMSLFIDAGDGTLIGGDFVE